MKEAEFREWLAGEGLVPSSVSTRISDLRRVEKHFGDLDEAFAQDGCAGIFDNLTYTAADQAAGKPNPSDIEIDGNLYDGLSGYKSSLTAYLKFRKAHAQAGSGPLSQADRIRRYVAGNYADPARKRDEERFNVISGDVHRAMGLANAMPAVCSALDSRKFADLINGELIDRAGPANSSTVSFTFKLEPAAPFGIDAAERELRRRYGEPIPTIKDDGNKYIVSFELVDGRQIALEKTGQSVRIWIESAKEGGTPPAEDFTSYTPDQGRQANLPTRLTHKSRTGIQPRSVLKVQIPDRSTLTKVLDWYDALRRNAGMLTREAIIAAMDECDRIGMDGFLNQHGFNRPRTYWIAERGKHYPCKAIANVALRAVEGPGTAIRDATRSRELVSRLGFRVVDNLDESLNFEELEKLRQKFLSRFPDFEPEGFAANSGGYYGEERAYKNALIEKAAEAIVDEASLSDEELGGRLLDLLTSKKSGVLGWRTDARINNLRAEHPGILERQTGTLVRSRNDWSAAADKFVSNTWPILIQGKEKELPYSESRNIASMVLALARPHDAMGINTKPLGKIYKSLTGKVLFGWNPLTKDEFSETLSFAEDLFGIFEEWGWQPRDLWDVQSFIWVVKDGAKDEIDSPTASDTETKPAMPNPTNLILYGPPGTGKTYRTAREAVRLCDGVALEDQAEVRARYDTLVEAGQIGFVTFHQSYAYEDFVEGLRPVTGSEDPDSDESSAGFRLEPRKGIFREIAALADQSRRNAGRPKGYDLSGKQFFKMSLGRAGSEDHIYDAAIEGNYIVLGYGGDIDWADPKYDEYQAIFDKWNELNPGTHGTDGNISQLWRFRSSMNIGDIVIVPDGNSNFRAIGEIVDDYEFHESDHREYNHRRAVRWLLVLDESLPVEAIHDGKFTMRSCYLMKHSKMKVEALSRLLPGNSVDPDAAPDQFVLIIDEINRANISKVFGELITLIEDDKRIGAENPMTVKLPYSGDTFGVPANLHIIGTMNTADRSIALLDTALRRRFTFTELMPDPEVLSEASLRTGVNLGALLRTLNERIEYLFDREHQIGHAYFIRCSSIADIHDTMRHRVIPLLAEYFYEDWSKVALVLGDGEGEGRFLTRIKLDVPAGMQSDGFGEERYRWQVRASFDNNAYNDFG